VGFGVAGDPSFSRPPPFLSQGIYCDLYTLSFSHLFTVFEFFFLLSFPPISFLAILLLRLPLVWGDWRFFSFLFLFRGGRESAVQGWGGGLTVAVFFIVFFALFNVASIYCLRYWSTSGNIDWQGDEGTGLFL